MCSAPAAMSAIRSELLAQVGQTLCAHQAQHPLRVGIDGVCGVGKTTFADDLAGVLRASGRTVIRLDSDGFHHVRAIRHRQGPESARGYYEDAYDFDSVRELVLVPLAPNGSRRYATRVHDLRTDQATTEWATAPNDAIVVFDATFLQRDDLRDYWDEVIYLDAELSVAQTRGVVRDEAALGGPDAATAAYEARYMAACRLYLAEQDPKQRASIVIRHDDPMRPQLIRGGSPQRC